MERLEVWGVGPEKKLHIDHEEDDDGVRVNETRQENWSLGVQTRPDIYWSVQSQKARWLKFWI